MSISLYGAIPRFIAQREDSSKVCELKKLLYGLKQSPQAQFSRSSSAVLDFELVRSLLDHSVFYRHYEGRRIFLVVYVDDLVIVGDDEVGIT